MITPKEAATLVDWPNSQRKQEIHDFVLGATAKDIQSFVHFIMTDTTDAKEWKSRARMALDISLANEAAKSAAKMERFTLWLIILTVVLIVVSLLALAPPLSELFCRIHK